MVDHIQYSQAGTKLRVAAYLKTTIPGEARKSDYSARSRRGMIDD